MNPVRYITRRVRVGLLLGVILAVYFTGSMVQLAPAQPVLPETDRKHRELRQEQAPPYNPCGGTYTRTSDLSGKFTMAVVQKEYLLSVSNYNDIPGAEPFTLMVRYP